MTRVNPAYFVAGLVVLYPIANTAIAAITLYKNHQQAEWFDAAGVVDTIDFVLSPGEILSDQYSSLGVTFTGGDDFAKPGEAYLLDGWGAYTNSSQIPRIELEFDIPRYSFAAHYQGSQGFILFAGGEVIYDGNYVSAASPTFFGVISTIAFDEVWLVSGTGNVAFDNIYFSQAPVPAPGAIALLTLGALSGWRRRRDP